MTQTQSWDRAGSLSYLQTFVDSVFFGENQDLAGGDTELQWELAYVPLHFKK